MGIGYNMGQENPRRRSVERPGMEIPKPVGCISRDLTMQEVLHYFQSYPVYKCPACFSILYYQAIKVCK